jgi:hypothetical protein
VWLVVALVLTRKETSIELFHQTDLALRLLK